MGWIDNAGHDYQELKQRISDQIEQTKSCNNVLMEEIQKAWEELKE